MKRTPLSRRTPLRPSGRLRARGRKATREQAALDEFRRTIRERAEGLCEVEVPGLCGTGWPHRGSEPHHIWPSDRDRGVHDPSRGVLVCTLGHRNIHANPALSRRLGFLKKDGDT